MPNESTKAADYSTLSPLDLLKMEVRTERQEEIPVGLIVQESALIDLQHAENLAESMMGDRKQISPTTVRAKLDGNVVVYDVIDEFHRSEGKRIIEQLTGEPQFMKTIVLYGCNDEELFDLRVLAASSVKSIKFARMAEWMKGSFLSTKWQNDRLHELAETETITLSQIFNLTQFDSSGKQLGLKLAEVIELKEWAKKKSKQWNRPLSALMAEMRTVELAAPDLVQKVRTGGGGKGGRGVLTRARLEAIVIHLPGDWETQILFADLAIARNILAEDLDFLTWSYAQAKEAFDQETMTKILTEPELLLNAQPIMVQKEPAKFEQTVVFSHLPGREEYLRSKKKRKSRHSSPTKELPVALDENQILKKHQVPEIIRVLMETILTDKGDDLTILNLQQGQLTLNLKSYLMKLNDQVIQLNQRETELMTIFFLLEGVVISERLLSMISLTNNRDVTKEAVLSLVEKMAELSEDAAQQLWIGRKDEFSWLKE